MSQPSNLLTQGGSPHPFKNLKKTLLIDKFDTLNQKWKRGRTKDLIPRQFYFKTRVHRKYLWNDRIISICPYFQMSFWFCLEDAVYYKFKKQIFINYLIICGDVPQFLSFLWIPWCSRRSWACPDVLPFCGGSSRFSPLNGGSAFITSQSGGAVISQTPLLKQWC